MPRPFGTITQRGLDAVTTLQEPTTDTIRPDAIAGRKPAALFHVHVIGAIFKRDFTRFFFNPAGYLFIAIFVMVCAVAAFWLPNFFTRNLDNLDTLSSWMPYILLFFIPAVTMGIWSDERKQGTDELLLTLPATDFDVVIGKYLAALGIYTVSLAFTLPLVGLLLRLGYPDLGVTFATYVGYWLTGAMLVAIGMVASQLTTNATISFILGAVFSTIAVVSGLLGAGTGTSIRRAIEDISITSQLHDFDTGVVTLSGVFFFLSSAAALLYLNMLLLSRRHWAGGQHSTERWGHALARVVALLVAVVSLNVLISRAGFQADLSEERMHTLSAESVALINQIPKDQPVYVQAFYSPEVPREYVSD